MDVATTKNISHMYIIIFLATETVEKWQKCFHLSDTKPFSAVHVLFAQCTIYMWRRVKMRVAHFQQPLAASTTIMCAYFFVVVSV